MYVQQFLPIMLSIASDFEQLQNVIYCIDYVHCVKVLDVTIN